MSQNSLYRRVADFERKIIDVLLEAEFPGRSEIRQQLNDCRVKTIDENGSLEFELNTHIKADVRRRIPIEGEIEDADGVLIHVLLHVVNGEVKELEIYKDDSSHIIRMPDASTLRLIQVG